MRLTTVTFIFDHAVVTTAVDAPSNVVTAASDLLRRELGIDTSKALEVSIHSPEDLHGQHL